MPKVKNRIDIHSIPWEAAAASRAIRRQVFVDEQGVSEQLEWDSDDNDACHYQLMLDGIVVATARLTREGRLGRMAVLRGYRRHGLARKLLRYVLFDAQSRNYDRLFLHAQCYVATLYAREGFIRQGDVFDEAGIEHIAMQLELANWIAKE